MRITDEMIKQAQSVDLVDYLTSIGYTVQKTGNCYKLKLPQKFPGDLSSLSVFSDRKGWKRWSNDTSGHDAISFIQKVLGKTFQDAVYKDLIELNLSIIITENVEFVDPETAKELLERKLTDMKQEEIRKVGKAAEASRGAFVDPIEGTQLAIDKAQAKEFLEDLQESNQKMTLCQFIIMVTASSYEELQQSTEAIQIVLRKYQIEPINAPYRQEQALCSVMPIGNSATVDREHNIQVRRTMSSNSTAVFMPFNARELLHEGGIYYGQNKMTHSIILFDRN